jgi:hypothetical protein
MKNEQRVGKPQQRRSHAESEQLVDAFEASGLRRREFCLKHGVALGTLDFWRKRRRQERSTAASGGNRLVAVELAGLPGRRSMETAGGGLVVVVSEGRRIEVSRGFDVATLERLLDVLEQG